MFGKKKVDTEPQNKRTNGLFGNDAKKVVKPCKNNKVAKSTNKKTPAKKTSAATAEEKKRQREVLAMKNSVPYAGVYEEMGMIAVKTSSDKEAQKSYSVMFRIGNPDIERVMGSDPYDTNKALAALLDGFPADVTYQFFVVNSRTKQEDFLSSALNEDTGDESIDEGVHYINDAIKENAPLGHNNMKRTKYIVFSLVADSPDAAIARFQEIEKTAKELFDAYSGLELTRLTIAERLETIYDIYNVGGHNFGARAGMDADTLDLDALARMGMSTKDLVIPRSMKEEKNYILFNDSVYARLFFISNFPSYLSENLIADLTSVSSTMIYSALYEPLDTDFVFELAKKKAAENTVITKSHVKRTLADQKANRIEKRTEVVTKTEDAYFTSAALDILTDAKAEGTKVFDASFLIVLYSDNKEDLERDTQLLTLSAAKFAFQLKVLDYAQKKALNSVLPLAMCYTDVRRVFPVSKLCNLNPMDVNAVLREHGMFVGVNSINDNILLVNRLNAAKPCGLISGIRNAGKTFECKREIFNSLISTEDQIVVIANKVEHDHYAPFLDKIGAVAYNKADGFMCDPFAINADYGVIDDGAQLKEEFLEALFSGAMSLSKDVYGRDEDRYRELLLKETAEFAKEGFKSLADVSAYMHEHARAKDFKYPTIVKALKNLDFAYIGKDAPLLENKTPAELTYFEVDSDLSLLIVLESVWKLSIEQKKKNRSLWIYIDAADSLIASREGARYLKRLLMLSNVMRNPLTIVMQNAARYSSGEEKFSFLSLLPEIGYYKLLNEGPLERKLFSDALNISGSLLPYITNGSVGTGLIISQSFNAPFNDNLHEILNHPEKMEAFFEPVKRKQVQ